MALLLDRLLGGRRTVRWPFAAALAFACEPIMLGGDYTANGGRNGAVAGQGGALDAAAGLAGAAPRTAGSAGQDFGLGGASGSGELEAERAGAGGEPVGGYGAGGGAGGAAGSAGAEGAPVLLSAAKLWEPEPRSRALITSVAWGWSGGQTSCAEVGLNSLRTAVVGYSNGNLYRSTDALGTPAWARIDRQLNLSTGRYQDTLPNAPVLSVAMSPCHPTTILVAFDQAVPNLYWTGDGGKNWQSDAASPQHRVLSVSVHPQDDRRVFAVCEDESVLYRKFPDPGWSAQQPTDDPLLANLPPGTEISSVVITNNSLDSLWLGTRGGAVFRTSNGGAAWIDWSSGLPARTIVRLDSTPHMMDYPGRVYVTQRATDRDGIWITGGRFGGYRSLFNSEFPPADAEAPYAFVTLAENPRDSSILYASTTRGAAVSVNQGAEWSFTPYP